MQVLFSLDLWTRIHYIYPSPFACSLYNDKVDHNIKLMEAAQKSAVPPDHLPNDMFGNLGVCVLRDLGGKDILELTCAIHRLYVSCVSTVDHLTVLN